MIWDEGVQNVMGEASFKEGEKSFKKGREELEPEANVTEWSKVLRSGRSVFARVGSSPTVCIFLFFLKWVSTSSTSKKFFITTPCLRVL